MAPTASKTPQRTKESSPASNAEDDVEEFFSFIDKYCSNGKFRNLRSIGQEKETLKNQINELRITYETNFQTLAQYQIDWNAERTGYEQQLKDEKSRYEQLLKDKEAADQTINSERENSDNLRSQIQTQEEDIKRLMDTTKKNEAQITQLDNINKTQAKDLEEANREKDKLQQELGSTEAQLEAKSKDLSEAQEGLTTLQSFVVNLNSLEDKKVQIREALGSMFDEAFDFFQSTLGRDLDDNLLMNSSNIKGHPSIQSPIILPASNSPAAKQMRVAAGLIIYGKALANHAFRPTYVTQSNDLDKLLRALAAQHPLQEAYVRAVLLKMLPDKQKVNEEKIVKMVVTEVSGAVGPWIPSEQRDAFESGLKQACNRACSSWALVQHIEERIRPDFSSHLLEDWQSLPTPSAQPAVVVDPPNQPAREPEPITDDEIARVVWPTFLAAGPQEPDKGDTSTLELVHHGYVLTQKQVKDVEEEVSQRATRRAMRRIEPRKRRDSAIFLSPGGLNGQDVK